MALCACVTFGAGVLAFNSQVEAYVRGAVSCRGSVENAAIENSTLGRSRYLDRGIPKRSSVRRWNSAKINAG